MRCRVSFCGSTWVLEASRVDIRQSHAGRHNWWWPSAGKVELNRKDIAQLIGKVFIQKSAVNLLSTVLDTPEFFWSAPDNMQVGWSTDCWRHTLR